MCSCATQKVFNDYDSICGNYYGKNKYANYYLTINKDFTFFLRIVRIYFATDDSGSFCSGKWKKIGQDKLFLKCNAEKSIAFATSDGYILPRERKVKILENYRLKIKVDDVVLEKTEETDSK